MITRVDGWQSSDGKIYKTEAEAIDQEQYVTVYMMLKDMFYDQFSSIDNKYAHAAAYIIAMNRKQVYDILKDNVTHD